MKRELTFKNTGNPSFISILNNTLNISDTADYVGVYAIRDGEKICFGSNELLLPNSLIVGFGDDMYTDDSDGFNYNEIMYPFIWDSQQDKFFDLIPTEILNYNDQSVDYMKYAPLAMYRLSEISLGGEITLKIPNEEAVVLKWVNMLNTFSIGNDPKLFLYYDAYNVKDVEISILSGNGYISEDKSYYNVSNDDTIIRLKVSGKSIYDDSVIEDIHLVVISNPISLYYKNSYFSLYGHQGYLTISKNASYDFNLTLSYISYGRKKYISKSVTGTEPFKLIPLPTVMNKTITVNDFYVKSLKMYGTYTRIICADTFIVK